MSDLARLQVLASLMLDQAAVVARAEEALEAAKDAYQRTEQVDLPELMREVGVSELKLEDGTKFSLQDEVSCNITLENRPIAADWLRENGFSGLLKTQLIIPFGRGAADAAHAMAERIQRELGLDPLFEELVHPSTLKSFVKEQREKGAPLPEAINVHPFSRVKITLPKP